jgi:hypothetical protein
MIDPFEAEVGIWMQQFAAIDDRQHALPDASVIWLKAQVLQSAKAVERASRPITTVQITAYVVVAASWAALLMWKWRAFQAWLNGFTPTHIILGAAGARPAASLSLTLLAALIVLASVTVMLAMHTILAEE